MGKKISTQLEPKQLRNCCDPKQFKFATTAELKVNQQIVGQERVLDSLKFGLQIQQPGYHLFAIGATGTGKYSVIKMVLQDVAKQKPIPNDWCYVNNFNDPNKPIALSLPAGEGEKFRDDMKEAISELRTVLPALLKSNDCQDALKKFKHHPSIRKESLSAWIESRRCAEKTFRDQFIYPVIDSIFQPMEASYQKVAKVNDYLLAVKKDILENFCYFLNEDHSDAEKLNNKIEAQQHLNRYQVNLIVNHANQTGAPIVYEPFPDVPCLQGYVEHTTQLGTMICDFNLIKAGALHQANGGYLLLDINKLLEHSNGWKTLKQALFANEVSMKPLQHFYSADYVMSIDPEPIPLNLKVIIIGNRRAYDSLADHDADFDKLFKVMIDFNYEIPRNKRNIKKYAELIASIVNKNQLRHLDRTAVASVIDHSSRLVNDSERLLGRIGRIADLLREADYWAKQVGHRYIKAKDVEKAIQAQIKRADRSRDRVYEDIDRKIVAINTTEERVGQINALTVIDSFHFDYTEPSRITAVTHLGKGEVIDIEREVDLGGSIHSKGVLILSGFINGRYAREKHLSFSASLVFEQNYSHVDGDSASLAELAALLSSIAGIPIKQWLAVTGSVNQVGEVQSVGSVTTKIEGFFDVCQRQGLTGKQGVIIPKVNIPSLMLRPDVVAAVAKSKFFVYAVKNIDEAMYLLTGKKAGQRNKKGEYPKDSVNYLVEKALKDFAEHAKEDDK